MTDYKFHEIANMFPLMTEEKLADQANDIKENGLLHPITLFEDKILDGRNRNISCKRAGVNPRYVTFTGTFIEAVAFVWSENIHRRDLTSSQRAAIIVAHGEMVTRIAAESRERQAKTQMMGKDANGIHVTKSSVTQIIGLPKEESNNPKPNSRHDGETNAAIAKTAGTNRQYVSDAKKIMETSPETFDKVVSGEMSIPKAIDTINPHIAHVARSNGEIEWYTPADIIEAARQTMVNIDLDPASTSDANNVINATNFYTIEQDGLKQKWKGNVWMNPPYASGLISEFVDKLCNEYDAENVMQACVLVNNATETKWFQKLAASANAIMFPKSRIRFWYPNRESKTPLQGQAVVYLGVDADEFIKFFAKFGTMCKVIR